MRSEKSHPCVRRYSPADGGAPVAVVTDTLTVPDPERPVAEIAGAMLASENSNANVPPSATVSVPASVAVPEEATFSVVPDATLTAPAALPPVSNLNSFLCEILGDGLEISKEPDRKLPGLLCSSYDIRLCKYAGGVFNLMIERPGDIRPIDSIEKHAAWLQELRGAPVAFVTENAPRYRISRLDKKRLPFVVPGLRAYLPFVGIVMRPIRASKPKEPTKGLGFASQQILVGYLNHCFGGQISVPAICSLFGYSRMTATKIMDELVASSFTTRRQIPGSHIQGLKFRCEGRELWDGVKEQLKSPVRKILPLTVLPEGIEKVLSGESALAECSMLAPPGKVHVAHFFKGDEYERTKTLCVPEEEASVFVEAWRYAPLLPGHTTLDPLSVWLCVHDSEDERVQGELEEMLEDFKW